MCRECTQSSARGVLYRRQGVPRRRTTARRSPHVPYKEGVADSAFRGTNVPLSVAPMQWRFARVCVTSVYNTELEYDPPHFVCTRQPPAHGPRTCSVSPGPPHARATSRRDTRGLAHTEPREAARARTPEEDSRCAYGTSPGSTHTTHTLPSSSRLYLHKTLLGLGPTSHV